MSNNSILSRGDVNSSSQTNLNNHRNLGRSMIELSLLIISLIASIYLFFFDSFLTTRTDNFNYIFSFIEDEISELAMFHFDTYSIARFDININGFVLGSLLILIGIFGIINIVYSQSRGSSLEIKTAILQLPTGILLITSSSLSKTGVNRLLELEEPLYAMSSFQTAYWLEIICYVLFLATTIMLAISAKRKKFRALETAFIVITIGFFIIILASIFSISTVNKFINNNFVEHTILYVEYTEVEIAGSLITALILTALAKIVLVIAFLFGLISFQRKTNKLYVIFFSIITAIYCILKVVNSMLSLIYSFTIFTPGDDFGYYTIYEIYYQRLRTTVSLTKFNMALYWIIFIAGVFGVLKSIVLDEVPVLISQETPRRSRTADIPLRENVLTDEPPSFPHQQVGTPEDRFCTVCGTIAADDSIVCATCGAYVQNG